MSEPDNRKSFIRVIRTLFKKDIVESAFWITKRGLFVRGDLAENVLESYIQWCPTQEGTVVAPSRVDAFELLYGSREPKEYYLVLGSQVVVGVLVELPTQDLRGVGIRLYEGIPLDTQTNLHPKDPLFHDRNDLACEQGSWGFRIKLQVKGFEFRIPFEFVSRLRTFLLENLEVRCSVDVSSLRKLVISLADTLSSIRPIGRKILIVYPSRLRPFKNPSLYACGDIALVNVDGVFEDFFVSRRRGYQLMVRKELIHLGDDRNSRNLAGAYISNQDGNFLSFIDISEVRHRFGVSAVTSFLEAIELYCRLRHGRLPGKLSLRPTVRELVIELAKLLKRAQPLLPDKVPTRLKGDIGQSNLFLSADGEWFMQVDRNKMIREVHFIPKAKKPQVTPIHYSSA